jgi:predicted metalloprotease with PDZ domain
VRAAILACALLASARPAAGESAIRYRVGLEDAARARGELAISVEIAAAPAPLELVFPAWLPGAYELRFFGRDVRALEAIDDRGRVLEVDRQGPTRFRVRGHAADARVVVRYRISAELLSDDGADVGPEHVYLNPGAITPLVRGRERSAHELVLEGLPRGWRAWSAELTSTAPPRIAATSYRGLIDQPIEAADPAELVLGEVRAAGAQFRVAIHGEVGVRARARQLMPALTRDLGRIAEAERALAGPLPFSHYLFVLHLSERVVRVAALEHAAAATVVATPRFLSAEERNERLHVLSHELFHTWNARRLVAGGAPDDALEQPESNAALWISEGLTEHAALVALGRCGLVTRAELVLALEEALTRARHAERAGLSLSALAGLAFSAPSALVADPDAYYAVGHVVSLALVAALLERTGGRVGLEELLGALLPPPGAPTRSIDTATLGQVLDTLAPPASGETPLSSMLTVWVERPVSFAALQAGLRKLGLYTETQRRERLDLAANAEGDPPTLRAIEPGGAYARAGAQRGDRVVRIDGEPANAAMIAQRARAPMRVDVARPIRLEVVRGGEALSLTLHPRSVEDVEVKIDPRVFGPHDHAAATRLARLLGALPSR